MPYRLLLILPLLLSPSLSTAASNITYTARDSIKITKVLTDASDVRPSNPIVHFARKFLGCPFVEKTLERNPVEHLVVNCHAFDCTTYVETVLAMSLCLERGETTLSAFLSALRSVRYYRDHISYATRKHYFSSWILDNTRQGFVREVDLDSAMAESSALIARKTLSLNYMSAHRSQYPMMARERGSVYSIREVERQLTGLTTAYIPKSALRNTPQNNIYLKRCIHDGDIIAIVTSISGLDVSHLGIAVWHGETLHLINASQVHMKVVEEPMTLFDYMQRHSKQMGIRIIRIQK